MNIKDKLNAFILHPVAEFWLWLAFLLAVSAPPAYFLAQYLRKTDSSHHQVACIQDAKQCPDGSFVMRSGVRCEFSTCPKIKTVNDGV